MSQEDEEDEDELVLAILLSMGIPRNEANYVVNDLSVSQKREIIRDVDINSITDEDARKALEKIPKEKREEITIRS